MPDEEECTLTPEEMERLQEERRRAVADYRSKHPRPRFNPESDSRIYPSLTPEDQAAYREMLDRYQERAAWQAGYEEYITPDREWELEQKYPDKLMQEHHRAMDYFRGSLAKRRQAGSVEGR